MAIEDLDIAPRRPASRARWICRDARRDRNQAQGDPLSREINKGPISEVRAEKQYSLTIARSAREETMRLLRRLSQNKEWLGGLPCMRHRMEPDGSARAPTDLDSGRRFHIRFSAGATSCSIHCKAEQHNHDTREALDAIAKHSDEYLDAKARVAAQARVSASTRRNSPRISKPPARKPASRSRKPWIDPTPPRANATSSTAWTSSCAKSISRSSPPFSARSKPVLGSSHHAPADPSQFRRGRDQRRCGFDRHHLREAEGGEEPPIKGGAAAGKAKG